MSMSMVKFPTPTVSARPREDANNSTDSTKVETRFEPISAPSRPEGLLTGLGFFEIFRSPVPATTPELGIVFARFFIAVPLPRSGVLLRRFGQLVTLRGRENPGHGCGVLRTSRVPPDGMMRVRQV